MILFVIVFILCSPLLIIGIIRFVNLFGYKASNIAKTEATLQKTDYSDLRTWSHSSYNTYSYMKIGTYRFELDGQEYEFTYSSDREYGYLPDTITACYPKGKPHKAFAEGNTPFIKEFFNAFLFIFLYAIVPSTISIVVYHFMG